MARAAGTCPGQGSVINMMCKRHARAEQHCATQHAETSDVCSGYAQPPMIERGECEALGGHSGVSSDARVRMDDAFRCPRGTAGGDDECVTALEGNQREPSGWEQFATVFADEFIGTESLREFASDGRIHPLIEGEYGITCLPRAFHLRTQSVGRREVDCHETRHIATLGGSEVSAQMQCERTIVPSW